MDKLILKKIARRYAKSILINTQAQIGFDGELTVEECSFIQEELNKIANKITSDKAIGNVNDLVAEYYTK